MLCTLREADFKRRAFINKRLVKRWKVSLPPRTARQIFIRMVTATPWTTICDNIVPMTLPRSWELDTRRVSQRSPTDPSIYTDTTRYPRSDHTQTSRRMCVYPPSGLSSEGYSVRFNNPRLQRTTWRGSRRSGQGLRLKPGSSRTSKLYPCAHMLLHSPPCSGINIKMDIHW